MTAMVAIWIATSSLLGVLIAIEMVCDTRKRVRELMQEMCRLRKQRGN